MNITECPPLSCNSESSMFSLLNVCRVLFYTPIIFLGGLLTSVAYDYITYVEPEDSEKSD